MNNIKKIISLLLTIQLLFACTLIPSAMATDSVVEEPIAAVEALVIDEGESPEELSPRMARGCSQNYSSKFLGDPNTTIVDTSVAYKAYIHFDSSGIADYTVHYTDHSSPKIHTNPHYHTFTFENGWWTPNVYHSGLPY
jgi:hypothetical protein